MTAAERTSSMQRARKRRIATVLLVGSLACSRAFVLQPVTVSASRSSSLLRWHPGAVTQQKPDQGQDDELDDDATYSKQWREKQLAELLQHPELSPSLVNDLLAPDYLTRQRHVLAPNEAFGAIFQLDALTDIASGIMLPVWEQVAEEYGLDAPQLHQVQRAMGMVPENAIMREFRWTTVSQPI